MYKCEQCNAVFDSPAEKVEEVDYFPRPFGNGSEPYGGGVYECCPCCDSEDFEKIKFDGESCPFCDKEIQLDLIENIDAGGNIWQYKCPHCKNEFMIRNGELL